MRRWSESGGGSAQRVSYDLQYIVSVPRAEMHGLGIHQIARPSVVILDDDVRPRERDPSRRPGLLGIVEDVVDLRDCVERILAKSGRHIIADVAGPADVDPALH